MPKCFFVHFRELCFIHILEVQFESSNGQNRVTGVTHFTRIFFFKASVWQRYGWYSSCQYQYQRSIPTSTFWTQETLVFTNILPLSCMQSSVTGVTGRKFEFQISIFKFKFVPNCWADCPANFISYLKHINIIKNQFNLNIESFMSI